MINKAARERDLHCGLLYSIRKSSDKSFMQSLKWLTLVLTITFFSISPILPLSAQSGGDFAEETPSWVLVQQGMHKLEDQQVSSAIEFFNEALSREGTLPEALYGLGNAYIGSGDDQLGIRELQQALNQSRFLYTPEDKYLILYTLAEVRLHRDEQRMLQDLLLGIVADDPYFTEDEHQDARRNYRRVIQQQGIDQLFQLYRLPEIFSRTAHRELGMQFLLQNLPSQAVDHLVFAALMGFSDVIEEMRRIFPTYEYSSVLQTYSDIFNDDPRTEHLREYLENDSFTSELLHLADAFYIEGQQSVANDLWRIVAQVPGPSLYRDRALKQLQEPTLPDSFIRRSSHDRSLK
ncbi:MAG: tetratricopeptide repeat protein [Spirochaeta sp.]